MSVQEQGSIAAARLAASRVFSSLGLKIGRPRIEGFVDQVKADEIVGWAYDPTSPNRRLQIVAVAGGAVIAEALADQPRKDLIGLGKGDGQHGFRLRIPPETPQELRSNVSIEAVAEPQNLVLQRGKVELPDPARDAKPAPASAATTGASFTGFVERCVNGEITGWAADRNDPTAALRVEVYNRNERLGTALCKRNRPDLQQSGGPPGAMGFLFKAPDPKALGAGANVRVRVIGSKTDLRRSKRYPGAAPAGADPAKDGSGASTVVDRAAVVKYLRETDDETLSVLLREARNVEVLARARKHFTAKNWKALVGFNRVLIGVSKEYERLLMLVGRGALYANDHKTATRILAVGAALYPAAEEMHYYCGVAHTRAGRHGDSIQHFRDALRLLPTAARTKRELGNALRRAARDAGTPRERINMISEAARLLEEALEQDYSRSTATTLARLHYDLGRNEEALKISEALLAEKPDEISVMLMKSRNLVALNRIGEALQVAQEVLKLDPLDQTARFQLRALRYLDDGEADRAPPTYGNLVRLAEGAIAVGALGTTADPLVPVSDTPAAVAAALSETPFDWLRVAKGRVTKVTEAELAEVADPFAGFCELKRPSVPAIKLWRRDALVQLLESGLVSPDLSDLSKFEPTYQRAKPPAKGRQTVVVMSRHGHVKFGGGEHFIESMAEHYESVGYDPIIVGVQPDRVGTSGVENGRRFAYVDSSPAALRRFFMENETKLVHVISGLGFAVTDALSHTNIPFIYGVHFWREALGDDSDEGYFDENGEPVPRAEFRYILSRASSVYANSQYTRSMLEKAYGVRCPVIYSVPRELETSHEA